MQLLLKSFSIFFLLALTSGRYVDSAVGYHEKIGIPRAQDIWMQEHGLETRIVGGSQVDAANAGIVVTLEDDWSSICGGSLLSNTRVLTAAHCWYDGEKQAKKFTIVLGSLTIFSGGTRVDSSDVKVHPSWNDQDITYDIAMVKIKKIKFSNGIKAIALPGKNDARQTFAGLAGLVSGYGRTRDVDDGEGSDVITRSLYQTTVTVLTNGNCQRYFDFPISGSQLCTSGVGGRGGCKGDSGGPLTVLQNNKRLLVGVVSFGLKGAGTGCQSGVPTVYTRVTSCLSWIQSNM